MNFHLARIRRRPEPLDDPPFLVYVHIIAVGRNLVKRPLFKDNPYKIIFSINFIVLKPNLLVSIHRTIYYKLYFLHLLLISWIYEKILVLILFRTLGLLTLMSGANCANSEDMSSLDNDRLNCFNAPPFPNNFNILSAI